MPKLPKAEQTSWLKTHIPHRVRAASARLKFADEYVGMQSTDGATESEEAKILWRCQTDSINEGRLTAIRWLINFVTQATANGDDVIMGNFDGVPPSLTADELLVLRAVKIGCNKASSHSTNDYSRPDVSEVQLVKSLKIITPTLQRSIYDPEGLNLMKLAFSLT